MPLPAGDGGVTRPGNVETSEAPIAPWGVQLAGEFLQKARLANFCEGEGTPDAVLACSKTFNRW